uniref:Uncharacterized protein n=1 Tax=Tetraselmis sp. GSL018 TaxID=582737 RepID=A0A061S3P3_9CHLO
MVVKYSLNSFSFLGKKGWFQVCFISSQRVQRLNLMQSPQFDFGNPHTWVLFKDRLYESLTVVRILVPNMLQPVLELDEPHTVVVQQQRKL